MGDRMQWPKYSRRDGRSNALAKILKRGWVIDCAGWNIERGDGRSNALAKILKGGWAIDCAGWNIKGVCAIGCAGRNIKGALSNQMRQPEYKMG
jgi:hypothetical protein